MNQRLRYVNDVFIFPIFLCYASTYIFLRVNEQLTFAIHLPPGEQISRFYTYIFFFGPMKSFLFIASIFSI